MNDSFWVTFLTGWFARLITKAAIAVGAASAVASTDRTNQVASALATVVVFGIELLQSYFAHRRALMTPPPVA